MRRLWVLFFCVATTFVYASPASEGLLKRLSHHRTMQSHFVQTVYGENTRLIQRVTGVMRISQPMKFYWSLDAPSNQVIVADGQVIWVYDKDLEQVVKRRQDSMSALPAQLLSGSLDYLSDDYHVALQKRGSKDIYTLTTEKIDTSFTKLELTFDDDKMVEMSLLDPLGQKSVYAFRNLQINQPISSRWYQFVPPKGVDVIVE
jgi:outer membrane lipoprotein carrier protein